MSFDYFPPYIESLFAPLSTAWRSDAETFTQSEPRGVGTTSLVSTNRTHMREARGSMRVRCAPTRRVPGTKNKSKMGSGTPQGARSEPTNRLVCDRPVGFLDTKHAPRWDVCARSRARALSGARAPPISCVRALTASSWQDPYVDVARSGDHLTRIGPRASRV